MADLGDDTIESLARCAGSAAELDMALEIKRRRAEQAAGREYVERVVREVIREAIGPLMSSELDRRHAIARRVADRLSAPVLSAEDVETLERIRRLVDIAAGETDLEWTPDAELNLIDRLIAGVKPPAVTYPSTYVKE